MFYVQYEELSNLSFTDYLSDTEQARTTDQYRIRLRQNSINTAAAYYAHYSDNSCISHRPRSVFYCGAWKPQLNIVTI